MAYKQTRNNGVTTLSTTPQTVTASWVDFGSEIATGNWKKIGLYFSITINNTNDFRFRLLQRHATGGTDHVRYNKTAGATISADDEFVELTDDADVDGFLSFDLNGAAPYVQLQIQAGTVGATGATLDAVRYILSDD